MANYIASIDENQASELVEHDKCTTTEADLNEKDIDRDIQHNATELQGWRLFLTLVAVGLGIFLVQLEITIVSTSLISITNDISGFKDVSWTVTAYLITYSGWLTILSKLSDIFGRRPLISASFVIFVAFSIGCGFSQSMETLIVLRAFQGIGGGGIYALCYVILPEIVPPHLYSAYAAYVAAVAAVSSLLGPLLGGAISNAYDGSWRWIFWLNGPVGISALCLILLGLPKNFPFHIKHPHEAPAPSFGQKVRRIDFIGAIFLLGACVLLITGLEEGGISYSWTNALPLIGVIISLVMWLCFMAWIRAISRRNTQIEAIFPWALILDRFAMGTFISAFFSGATFIALAISLPQRFQIIHGSTPFLSGVYILPLTISLALGAAMTGVLLARLRIPPFFIMLASAILQVIGVALIGNQTVREGISTAMYGLQVLIGFSLGLNITTSLLLAIMVVRGKFQAVAIGSIGQLRNLGGSIVLAVFANVLNSSARDRLATVLTPGQLDIFLQYPESISSLPIPIQDQVKDAYDYGYQLQLRVLLAFSCGAVIAVGFIYEKHPRHQNKRGELV